MLLPGYREKSGTFLQLHSWGHHPPSFPFWSLPLLSRAPSGGSQYLFVSKSSTFLPAQLKLYWPPLSGHPRKVPIFSRGCPCLFLKGLGSLPHRCRLMLSARKVELLCNFIRRGITLLSSPSGLRLSRPQPADNSNGHHAPQAQARGLLPLCEHLWLPFTELRPQYIYDSQDLI